MHLITDCEGRIIGNPNGYRTFRGAYQQVSRRGSKVHKAAWTAFYQKKETNPDTTHVWSIKLK